VLDFGTSYPCSKPGVLPLRLNNPSAVACKFAVVVDTESGFEVLGPAQHVAAPGKFVDLHVKHSPGLLGHATARMQVTYKGGNLSITLKAECLAPTVTASSNHLTYGDVEVGHEAAKSITLTNHSPVAVKYSVFFQISGLPL
jgi:hydrocephalus-inducing protein